MLFRPSPQLLQAWRRAITKLLPIVPPTKVNAPLASPYLAVHLRLGGMLGEARRVDRVQTVAGPAAALSDDELTVITYNCSLALAAKHGLNDLVLVTDNMRLHERANEVKARYRRRLHALRLNRSGHPSHPLYLPAKLVPLKLSRLEKQLL